MAQKKIRISKYSDDELLGMSRDEIILETGISDREISFCEYYIRDYNPKLAAIKAGYLNKGANAGDAIRRRQRVIDYLAWLKAKICYQANISAVDLLNGYAKMAFYDVTDYFVKDGNKIKLKSFDEIDGQIIQEISQSATGAITVKFPDRMKSYEKLENYLTENPYDWKRKIEERKLEIMEQNLLVSKTKAGIVNEIEDDNFAEALLKASENLWDKDKKGEENEGEE